MTEENKELDYCCDKCEVEMEIFDIGILSSLEDECNFTSKMICLCKPCLLLRWPASGCDPALVYQGKVCA